jgi:CHAD domain-containing protein
MGSLLAPILFNMVALKAYSEREERRYQENGTGAVTHYILRRLLKSTANLKTKHAGWREIRPCLCKSYARGRLAYLKATRYPTPANFHEWRKEVKNLRDQLDFMCPARPQRMKDIVSDLRSLGDQLGDDHDLVLLKQFAQEQCARYKETKKLAALIDLKRAEFQTDIFGLGSLLFQCKPDQACMQLKEDWKIWRQWR